MADADIASWEYSRLRGTLYYVKSVQFYPSFAGAQRSLRSKLQRKILTVLEYDRGAMVAIRNGVEPWLA